MTESIISRLTQHDVECAKTVLSRGQEEDFTLPVLTDEEIVALDGIDQHQAVELPWLSRHPDQKELLCNVALRSLLSKGFAIPLVAEGDNVPSKLGATEEITGIMALRRLGERVVTAELTKESDKVWLYGYVHDDKVLEELVDSSGSHTFAVVDRSEFPARIMELANAAKVQSADEATRKVTGPEFEKLAPQVLGSTLGVTMIRAISLAVSTFSALTIYTSATELHGLTAHDEDGEAQLELTKMSNRTAEDKVRALVDLGV